MRALPIDDLLPTIQESLRQHPNLVLTAEPGAGKTTRVPPSLITGKLIPDGQSVIVLEPRRIAARAAATFVAREQGVRLGGEVGYRVRFDERGGPGTRLWFVTEGILTRMLGRDPYLEDVGAVILDEFHERHLQGDLALAVLRELQQTVRPELRILVMSATLAAEAPARFLGDCPVLSAPGRAFPTEIQYLPAPADRMPAEHAAFAVARALERSPGDVLVFLPGAAEIRRTGDALAATVRSRDLLVLPLHGELPLEEQDRALRPADRRKVILATNVAESSITVDGVSAVVDTGLARVLRHDLRRGVDVLRVERISRASADQRAGRAGRQGPGLCVRLWPREEQGHLPEADTPEVRRVDLASAVLELAAWGQRDPAAFGWFEAPEPAALQRARSLLVALGAVEANGEVTGTGRRMLRFGVAPRISRMLVEAERTGALADGALLAALASERDICLETRAFRGRGQAPRESASSDLLLRAGLFVDVEHAGFAPHACQALGLDPGAVRAVARTRDGLLRQTGTRGHGAPDPTEAALLRCVLAGFPDRVARRKEAEGRDALLVGGRGARLHETSVVREGELFVAVDLDARDGDAWATVRQASLVERAWLAELFPHAIREVRSVEFDAATQRVFAVRRTLYHDLVLEESRGTEVDPAHAGELLAELARRDPWRVLGRTPEVERLLARARWLVETMPDSGFPRLDDAWLGEAAADLCTGRRSLREIDESKALDAIQARLGFQWLRMLDRDAPDRIQLPSGRHARIRYEKGKEPAVASRMQDFFGMQDVPRLAGGRVAVVLELLAPNQRPVQITKDLPSFWANVYPKVRTELRRRYPRHQWPETPA